MVDARLTGGGGRWLKTKTCGADRKWPYWHYFCELPRFSRLVSRRSLRPRARAGWCHSPPEFRAAAAILERSFVTSVAILLNARTGLALFR
jgi:hypothetical protein